MPSLKLEATLHAEYDEDGALVVAHLDVPSLSMRDFDLLGRWNEFASARIEEALIDYIKERREEDRRDSGGES